MGTNELVEKIREYRELKRFAEEMMNAADSIGDELKAFMLAQGQEKMICGEYKLSYTDVSRTDIDRKRLKEERGEIFSQYSYSTVYKRFLVS
jgi:predicted phage-related endonuclease